jgi:hypothetical protein
MATGTESNTPNIKESFGGADAFANTSNKPNCSNMVLATVPTRRAGNRGIKLCARRLLSVAALLLMPQEFVAFLWLH